MRISGGESRARGRRAVVVGVIALVVALAASVPAGAVKPPDGAARPVPGTGIGTAAAMQDARCSTGDQYGVYGRWNGPAKGAGTVCVTPWKAGDDNGGKTAQGVTATSILVAVAIDAPSDAASATSSAAPTNLATNARGTVEDGFHDTLLSMMKYYETWGRDIVMKFFTVTGSDEAAQRADAVAIKAMKPFIMINSSSSGAVFESEVAKAKIIVWGRAATAKTAKAQAPYRWGENDVQATTYNALEVLQKQLIGKKAQYGGDSVTGQTRKFGLIAQDSLDLAAFKVAMQKASAPIAAETAYNKPTGGVVGDATISQNAAAEAIPKLKAAGVTTVILFADPTITNALMANATKQDFFPEWFVTGAGYSELALFGRGYDQSQAKHMFGLATLGPWYPALVQSSAVNPIGWYWGPNNGTQFSNAGNTLRWMLPGIQAAGPKLTAKTFQQGWFSIPATGGAATGNPLVPMSGYGKTAGLPYDQYLQLALDYAPVWWDPDAVGPSPGTGSVGKGNNWYVDGGKRYKAGSWPTKPIAWFSKTGAVVSFDSAPPGYTPPVAGDPCSGCPSTGGTQKPGTPSKVGFTAKYGGTGSTASTS